MTVNTTGVAAIVHEETLECGGSQRTRLSVSKATQTPFAVNPGDAFLAIGTTDRHRTASNHPLEGCVCRLSSDTADRQRLAATQGAAENDR